MTAPPRKVNVADEASPDQLTLKEVLKSTALVLEVRYNLIRIKRLEAALQRKKARQGTLIKRLWGQLFTELRRELAKPNRDMKRVAVLVGAMRKLVPPPSGRHDASRGFPASDQLADQFAAAFVRARQRSAEEEFVGDPTDVGTERPGDS